MLSVIRFGLQNPTFPESDLTREQSLYIGMFLQEPSIQNRTHTTAEDANPLYRLGHRLIETAVEETYTEEGNHIKSALLQGVILFESIGGLVNASPPYIQATPEWLFEQLTEGTIDTKNKYRIMLDSIDTPGNIPTQLQDTLADVARINEQDLTTVLAGAALMRHLELAVSSAYEDLQFSAIVNEA